MNRRLKLRDAFPQSADEYTQPLERLLQFQRAGMDATWRKLEEEWAEHNERMARFGLAPRADAEGVIKLNVGGSSVTVCWHLLAAAQGFEGSILGALLEGDWGEGKIPRDADGRIVLDESPTCINHIIVQTTLQANGCSSSVAVAADEVPYLVYTAHLMGLPESIITGHPQYFNIRGGSTTLEPLEIAPLGAKLREWVGRSTEQMTLIYRATWDGFDTKAFKPLGYNEDRSHTISLIRVSSGEENDDDDDSIVGAYSVIPWGCGLGGAQIITADTFLFMLKDGNAARMDPSKATKWKPRASEVGHKFTTTKDDGACIGGVDLFTTLDETAGGCTLQVGRKYFDIREESPFLALNGNTVVDVEVYRLSEPSPPTTTRPSVTEPIGDYTLTDADAHNIRSFGETIASSLMQERVVLDRAVKEMEMAGAKLSAAVGALETVYGPGVAGEQDAVVELNVRGTRMTTLRSTLQACPHSALAIMFNEERWPATDKDKDEHGTRLIDCNPTCFSKILDVLRMRKRASWRAGVPGRKQKEEKEAEVDEGGGGGKKDAEEVGPEAEQEEAEQEGEKEEEVEVVEEVEKDNEEGEEEESIHVGLGAVFIKEADVEAFGEAVNMYFPGCESFIMGLVQSM